MISRFFVVSFFLLSTFSLFSDTFTWTSAVSGNFEDSTKWTLSSTSASPEEGIYPGEGDEVIIPSYDSTYTVTVNKDLNIASLEVGSVEGASVTVCFKNGVTFNNVSGDVTVRENGVLCQTPNPKEVTSVGNVRYKLNLKVGGDMTILGKVTADISGFHKSQALRYGHGGYGGRHDSAAYGSIYGSIREPTTPGAGGQAGISGDGHGGGAIYLDVTGDVVVSGTVSADAEVGFWDQAAAGGSILIKCATLSGAGKIYARPGSYGNTQGGGGRIALYQSVATDWSAFTGKISSSCNYDYNNSNQHGSPGTIYKEHAGDIPTEGDLIIDGTTKKYKQPVVISTKVTDALLPFGRVILKNAGYLRVENGATLKVRKAITVGSSAVLSTQTGTAAIELVPYKGGTVEISGALTAQNFICSQPDSTILFANGAKVIIPSAGTIQITGTEEEPINLLPATESAKYQISLGNDLNTDSVFKYTAVSNCNSSANSSVMFESSDLGGNSNTFFLSVPKPGDRIVWQGTKDTVWSNAANWSPTRVPLVTDIVEIPAGCAKYPTFSKTVNVGTLKIASGASLTVNGASLVVAKDFENFGTLNLKSGGILKFEGDLDQEVELNESMYSSISIQKAGGTVNFKSGFAATIFNAYATGATSLVFAQGEEVAVDWLNIDGVSIEGESFIKNISISSSSAGVKWKLKAGYLPIIRGASIADCDASMGSAVKVGGLCDNATGNVNVDFSQGAAYFWTGAAGTTDFNTAENWLPQEVPASGFIQINPRAANTSVVLPKTETSLNLYGIYVAGIGVTAKFTAREHINLADSFVIDAKGTVALDYRDLTKEKINTVSGDFLVRNGAVLTHSALPSTANKIADGIYAICVKVLGDMRVDASSKIDVGSCGYSLGKGPGTGGGASHGACGGAGKACYGSIFNPTTHGSSGPNNDYGTVGGGVVNLHISGDLYLDGPICASVTALNKKDGRHDGGGAGGSVLVKCATLRGAGEISAYGNPNGNSIAGGGRIAIYQHTATDWSQYTGKIINGNKITNKGACGPIYLETAADKPYGGILKIVTTATSGHSTTARTQFPMSDDEGISYRDLTIQVEGGYLSLDGSGAPAAGKTIYVKDIILKGSYSYTKVLCKGRVLCALSRAHKNGKGWASTYANHVTEDGGKVRWAGSFAIAIR